jgi:outer membrane murein-binding lipoprotein Lpp
MKKMVLLIMMLGGFLLAGCSVELDTSTSKSEQLAEDADDLSEAFSIVKQELKSLQKKKTLTAKDQELVAQQLKGLIKQINDFTKEDGSFLTDLPRKATKKVMDKKEKVLAEMLKKAEKGKLKPKDIDMLDDELSDDIEFKLFK